MGIMEQSRFESVTVGTANVQLAQQQQEGQRRKLLYIRNTSVGAQVITVVFGDRAAANVGFVLSAGEFITDSDSGDNYQCWQGQVIAVSSAAGGTVSVVEV